MYGSYVDKIKKKEFIVNGDFYVPSSILKNLSESKIREYFIKTSHVLELMQVVEGMYEGKITEEDKNVLANVVVNLANVLNKTELSQEKLSEDKILEEAYFVDLADFKNTRKFKVEECVNVLNRGTIFDYVCSIWEEDPEYVEKVRQAIKINNSPEDAQAMRMKARADYLNNEKYRWTMA